MPIFSQSHQMVPAVYQPLYKCTVYFTTKEDGFAHPGNNPTPTTVYNYTRTTPIATNTYPYNFVHNVKKEGYGRVTTPFNSPSGTTDYYLGWDTDLLVYFADTAARAGATILHPTVGEDPSVIHSCAIDRTVSPRIPRNYYIETTDTNISVSTAMDTSEFKAIDTGATDVIVGYHVDLYYGDDEPLSETNAVSKHCTFQGDDSNQHTIILIGPNP